LKKICGRSKEGGEVAEGGGVCDDEDRNSSRRIYEGGIGVRYKAEEDKIDNKRREKGPVMKRKFLLDFSGLISSPYFSY
jgi:hypothetical protein